MNEKVLSVENLTTSFPIDGALVPAVKDVSFELFKGETLGLVGESGSGKSVTSLSILKLVSKPGIINSGKVIFKGRDLLTFSEKELRNVRGNEVSMIFQEPMTSLNPVFTVGDQIAEVLKVHAKLPKKQARDRAIEALKKVGIPAPEKRIDDYPHMLSGGMRQRVMIAMALICEPDVLIADEPTTALDVTIQAQILDLIEELQESMNMSVLLITHDLGVVQERCDRVIMMYGGQIIEELPTKDLFNGCKHPYTFGLLKAIPKLGHKEDSLYSIPGNVPKLGSFPVGCRFVDRCFNSIEKCHLEEPQLESLNKQHKVRCFNQVQHD